jgi:hydroxyacylglutathione hydrolase
MNNHNDWATTRDCPYIIAVPVLKDNYIWLIIHPSSAQCLITDPGDAAPVMAALQTHKLTPIGILLTHHHYDHTDGVAELLKHYDVPVYGAANEIIPTVTYPLWGGETLEFFKSALQLLVLSIPGHTRGHLAYYGANAVFCGDTLFTAACGRVFEGTMAQMYDSLQQLAALPDNTQVYCGHEYTSASLVFACAVEPGNARLQQRVVETQALIAQGLPTVPSTLALEKATNPFLRCNQVNVKQAAERHCGKRLSTPEKVFTVLREWKNGFKT